MATAEDVQPKPAEVSKFVSNVPSALKQKFSMDFVISALVVICFIAVRLWRLTAASLDGDEMCSLVLVRYPWHGLLGATMKEATHPPLFYVLLKLWIGIGGESLFWLRLLPMTISVLCLIPFFWLSRILELRPLARNLALVIATVHPYAIFYAQHLRMYSLLMLCALMSVCCFESYLRRPSFRNLALLSIVNLAMIYTHYYSWMILGIEFLFLIWQRRRWQPFAVAAVLTGILFAPWLWMASRMLRAGGMNEKIGWISRPALKDLAWFFADLTGFADHVNFGVGIAVAIIAIFLILFFTCRRDREAIIHRLAILAVVPALLLFGVSQWLPLWGSRHLIFMFWPFVIILADSLCRLPGRAVFAVMMLTAIWAAFALQFHYHDDRKLPWDTLTATLLAKEQGASSPIPFYSLDRDLHFPPWFYMECLKAGNLGPFGSHLGNRADIAELATTAAKFQISKVTSPDAVRGQHFWLGYSDKNEQGIQMAQEIINRRGCWKGDAISASDRFHSVILVPVQCD